MKNFAITVEINNQNDLAARARRDGRMMAVLLKVSPPRSDLKAFHRLFDTLATKYSRMGITEFESAFYENIQ